MQYKIVLREETTETLKDITRQQARKNVFVNVSVKPSRKDKGKNTIRIG